MEPVTACVEHTESVRLLTEPASEEEIKAQTHSSSSSEDDNLELRSLFTEDLSSSSSSSSSSSEYTSLAFSGCRLVRSSAERFRVNFLGMLEVTNARSA